MNDFSVNDVNSGQRTLQAVMPKVYQELEEICEKLENHYGDMQDIEFTIEKDCLYLLQTRNAKRTALSGIKNRDGLIDSGVISREEAIFHVTPSQVEELLHPGIRS